MTVLEGGVSESSSAKLLYVRGGRKRQAHVQIESLFFQTRHKFLQKKAHISPLAFFSMTEGQTSETCLYVTPHPSSSHLGPGTDI